MIDVNFLLCFLIYETGNVIFCDGFLPPIRNFVCVAAILNFQIWRVTDVEVKLEAKKK